MVLGSIISHIWKLCNILLKNFSWKSIDFLNFFAFSPFFCFLGCVGRACAALRFQKALRHIGERLSPVAGRITQNRVKQQLLHLPDLPSAQTKRIKITALDRQILLPDAVAPLAEHGTSRQRLLPCDRDQLTRCCPPMPPRAWRSCSVLRRIYI